MRRMLSPSSLIVTLLLGCGPAEVEDGSTGTLLQAATTDLSFNWQPFTRSAAWNLRLSPTRSETALPAAVRALGSLAPNDSDYGIKVYFASASDPVWSVRYGGYNAWDDNWNVPNPLSIRAPAGMTAPSGGDGSIVIVDEQRRYAYEIWQFRPTGATTAQVSNIDKVDLASDGVHRNVGLSAGGLPGSGGIIKSWEISHGVDILHKIWLSVHPSALYARAVWPASTYDVSGNGSQAFFNYGDVIAITKTADVNSICGLSPFMRRIAKALQDFGGIVQDQGGSLASMTSEVNSWRSYIDIDYNTTMWTQLSCLKSYLVKVNDPWTGATPGGLGYDVGADTSPPTVPPAINASPIAATQVNVNWSASSDNIGVAGYRVFRNNAQIASSPTLAFQDAGVQPSTRYSYFVRAYDAAGNLSSPSTTVSATTPAASGNPELLPNPGFESGATSWTFQKWSGNPALSVSTARKRSGASSFLISNASGQDGAAVSPLVSVTAGARYTASAWLSLENVSWGAGVLMIDWLNAAGGLISTVQSTGKTQNTSGFTQETLTATAPAGAVRAYLFLFSYARGKVYYDDVSFKRQ